MTVSGRGQARERILRRAAVIAIVLALLTLLFLASGHWLLGIIFGAAAAVATWLFLQARTVR
jgi:uncharacterized membrane protein YgaE (UPF0421/DUF939 family)